jgi:hypothetical protein
MTTAKAIGSISKSDHTAERGHAGAKREDHHRDLVGVDADPARHLRVIDGSAYGGTHPRLFHRQPEHDPDDKSADDHEQAVDR